MRTIASIELICTTLSFFAAYFLTNSIIEKLCARKRLTLEAEQVTMRPFIELIDVDSKLISRENPREEFVFSMEPWAVMSRMASKDFVCPRTSQANPIKVIVIIKSAPSYIYRRDAVRKSWGMISHLENMVVHCVFIVGKASANIQIELDKENAAYGDILQYVGVDDYRNVARKVLAGMQWTMTTVADDYFYVTSDDDMIVNMTSIPKLLRLHIKLANTKDPNKPRSSLISRTPILCIYAYFDRDMPDRDPNSKYYLDMKEYPSERLPPYCRGGFYMMPVATVAKLYKISRSHKALPMDDVWITGILRNLLPISERSIDAIDISASNNFIQHSDHIIHLMGDLKLRHDRPTMRPADELLANWTKIYQVLRKKKHCILSELKHIS